MKLAVEYQRSIRTTNEEIARTNSSAVADFIRLLRGTGKSHPASEAAEES